MREGREGTDASASLAALAACFPEVRAGGYTAVDGTVEFYGRVHALLRPEMTVLDFGAGRGGGVSEDTCHYRRRLRMIRGQVAKVVACDVDEAVLSNPGVDEAVVIVPDAPLPFPDASFDLIVSDFVFEHIADPKMVSEELRRVLKPGGWLCARTPNRYGLVSLATRLLPNRLHALLLRRVQPDRDEVDVFPTVFRLNSQRALTRWFPPDVFDHCSYRYEPEPSYFFGRRWLLVLLLFINRLLPALMKTNFFIFLRRR